MKDPIKEKDYTYQTDNWTEEETAQNHMVPTSPPPPTHPLPQQSHSPPSCLMIPERNIKPPPATPFTTNQNDLAPNCAPLSNIPPSLLNRMDPTKNNKANLFLAL